MFETRIIPPPPSNVPCKDCPDRHTGCHGHCEKYKQFKIRTNEQKEKFIKDYKETKIRLD